MPSSPSSPSPSAQGLVRVVVLMGVTGSGKTTIGAMLAGRLHWHFADGDDFHSAANIEKMHSGIPLTDADRQPWLAAIARQIDAWRSSGSFGVVTCSALKREYRAILIGNRDDVRLVYLKGDHDTLADRVRARHGHFMPASLLDSQLATLEEPGEDENPVTVSVGASPPELVTEIVDQLKLTRV